MKAIDQLGREVVLPACPQKIISLVPSQTELLSYLGLEKETIGITKFCIHPMAWFRNKKRVGGTKTLNLDTIQEINPDLILANKEENTREQLEALSERYPLWISDVRNLEHAYEMIQQVGNITCRSSTARELVEAIRKKFNLLQPAVTNRPALYLIWRDPWMSINQDTFIHDMMMRCGFVNVASHLPERYPVLSDKQLSELNPEFILLPSEPYPFKEKHISEIQILFPCAKILLVDGEAFSWYGSGLLRGMEKLKEYSQAGDSDSKQLFLDQSIF